MPNEVEQRIKAIEERAKFERELSETYHTELPLWVEEVDELLALLREREEENRRLREMLRQYQATHDDHAQELLDTDQAQCSCHLCAAIRGEQHDE